jgi:ribonuclease BN (tRNA processing enzyme)
MKLVILGNNGPYPSAGGACSGYLLSEGEHNILIDCGSGVLSNLQKVTAIGSINSIILTHLHSDHISDMMVLKYLVQIERKKGISDRKIKVYAPNAPESEFRNIDIKDAFDITPLNEELQLILGGMEIRFAKMKHPVPAYGVSFESGGRKFVFSGDTSWNDDIIRLARGADLLMLDAGLLSRDKTSEDVPHLTAEECGKIARASGARRLLLTHFWPGYDKGELLSEAAGEFTRTETTEIMKEYTI